MNKTYAGKRRTGSRRWILWIVVIAIAALFAVRFQRIGRRETLANIRSVQESEGKPVEVVTAGVGDLEVWNTLAGTVEGSVQYPIVSTNAIRVVDVVKKEGDVVQRGDVVIRLEKTAPNPMLHSYVRAKAVYEDAQSNAERMRNLYGEGAISRQVLDQAEMALKIARSDLTNATEGTDLVAAHAGVVTSVEIEEGDLAGAHAPLAWIARTDTVKITFEAGSRQAVSLAVGQRAVWFSRGTGDSGEGVISRLDLAADPESHLLSGEALFANPERKLIPGLLVSFRVLTGERRGVVKIPIDCLIESRDGFSVYVVESGGDGGARARLRRLTTGIRTSDEIEATGGVQAGELVVQFGQTRLGDGDLVKIVKGGEGM